DPAAARRRAVVLQLRVTGERLVLLVPAADLAQHGLGARLLDAARRRIRPLQRLHERVALLLAVLELLPDQLSELEHEPEVAAAVVLRLDRLPVPLQKPLRIRERPVLLRVR